MLAAVMEGRQVTLCLHLYMTLPIRLPLELAPARVGTGSSWIETAALR